MKNASFMVMSAWLLAGCGEHPQEPGQVVEEAVTAQCTSSTLAWDQPGANSGVCAGPWEYRTYTLHYGAAQNDSPACPWKDPTSHPEANTCRLVNRFTSLNYAPALSAHKVQTCVAWGPLPRCDMDSCPPRPCKQYTSSWVVDRTCDDFAAEQLSSYQDNLRQSIDASIYGSSAISGVRLANVQNGARSNGYPTCTFSLTNVPVIEAVTDSQRCGVHPVPDPQAYWPCQLVDHLGGVEPVKYSPAGQTEAQIHLVEQVRTASSYNSKSVVAWSDQVVKDEAVEHGIPSCTTCDDLPLNGTSTGTFKDAYKDKAKCLLDRLTWVGSSPVGLPADVAATTRAQIVQNLLLLAELYGDKLDPSQIDQVITAVRGQTTLVQSGCGVWSPPSDATCAPPQSLLNSLSVCADLVGSSVSAAVDGVMLDGCLDAAQDIARLPAGNTCQGLYRAAFVNSFVALLKKRLTGVKLAQDGSATAELQQALRWIDRWYRLEAGAFGAGSTSPVWGDVGQVETALWALTHANGLRSLKLPPPSDAGVDADTDQITAALANADGSDIAADYATLVSAFTPTSDGKLPLSSPPLLVLTHDALRSVADHVRDAAAFHDFACHYATPAVGAAPGQDACQSVKQTNRVSEMTALLAHFASEQELGKTLDGLSTMTAHDSPNWSAPFALLRTNHADFERAVIGAIEPAAFAELRPAGTYDASLVLNPNVATATPALAELGRLATEFTARAHSYDQAGLFDPKLRAVLSSGIQSGAQHQQFVSNLQLQNANLIGALKDYRNNLRQIVGDLLGYFQSTTRQYDTTAQLNQKVQQFSTLQSQLAAMQSAEAAEEAAFGKQLASFAKDFGNVKDSGAIDPNALVKVDGQHFYQDFSETQVKFAGQAGDQYFSIPGIAVDAFPGQGGSSWKVSTTKGAVLTIDSSGHWSPTCALQQWFGGGHAPTSDGSINVQSFPGKITTSEGFQLQSVDSAYTLASQSHSETSSDTISVGVSASACAGYSAFGFASVQACVTFAYNHNWSWSDQGQSGTGGESRTSASFVSGLRVPNTPFPSMPAGSLVLVTMKSGGTGWKDIVDVRPVLAGQNAYVIGGDKNTTNVDLYLVVNDRNGYTDSFNPCIAASGGNKLHIDTSLFQPLEATLPHLMAAMGQALDFIVDQRSKTVDQGRFLPDQQAYVRSNAIAYLGLQGIDLSAYPQPFRDLYSTWIDRQMARIERAVEIANATKQSDLLFLEISALRQDQNAAALNTRLTQFLPLWSLQDLEGEQMRFQANLVTKLLNDLYPVLRLRYPELLGTIQGSSDIQLDLQQLLQGAWDTSYWAQASLMGKAAQKIIALAASNVPARTPLNPVALQFPKSARIRALYPNCGAVIGQQPNTGGTAPPTPPSGGTVFSFKTVDQDRADALWKGLCEAGLGTFVIRPEDLYDISAGISDLDCHDTAPVMRSLALVFTMNGVASSDPLANFAAEAAIGMNESLLFTTPQGLERYQLTDRSFLPSKVAVLGAPIGQEVNHFKQNQTDTTAGDGLSPFNTYQVDLRKLEGAPDSPLIKASALNIVFQAESANVNGLPVAGVAACTGAH